MKTLPSSSRLAALLAIALSASSVAHAQTVIIYAPVTVVDASTSGFYNSALGTILDGTAPQFPQPLGSGGGDPLINPSAEPNLAAATNILGNWLTPHSALNANWQQLATIPTAWAGNTETAIIYEINGGTHGFTNLVGNFDADNGLFVWVNGQYKFGARGPGLPSPAGQFEYTNIFLGNLLPGTNRIQIIREDNFDATGYQVRITGNPLGGTPQTCTPSPSGAVGWWRAENNATDVQGTNNGALAGGISYAAGEVGQAFLFNNALAAVVVPSSPSLNVGSGAGLTVEAWIKPADVTQAYPLFEWNDSTYWGVHFYIAPGQPTSGSPGPAGAGQLYANVVDSSGGWHQLGSAAGVVAANVFQHVVLTYDKGSGLATIYRNGEVVSQLNIGSFSPLTTQDLYLGRRQAPIAEVGSFSGLMDEPAVYNRALSQAEVQSIYNAGSNGKCTTPPPVVNCVPAPTGLVSWWKAESNGLDSADGNNGTLLNGASFAAGKVNQAFSFDGVDDHFRVADQLNLRMTNGLTIEGWFYPTIVGGDRELVSKWDAVIGPDQRSFTMALQSDGRAYLGLSADGVNVGAVVYSASPIPANQWSYLSVTYDGAALRIYVNGVLENQSAYSGGIFPGTSDVGIGQNVGGTAVGSSAPFGAPYAGRIDELAIYNRALTTSEIAAIYNAGNNGKCTTNPPVVNCTTAPSGLVSWWTAETNALDGVGGNNGTAQGGLVFGVGKVGSAFSYDGFNSFINVAPSASLNVGAGNGLTVECWIKPGEVALRPLVEWHVGSGAPLGVHFWIYDFNAASGVVGLYANLIDTSGNYHQITSGDTLVDTNNFHHVAVSYDKTTGQTRLYADGLVVAEQNLGVFTPQTSYPLYFGNRPSGVSAGLYRGLIDEVGLYSRALTMTEIQSIYNSSTAGKCPLPPPPLITQHPANQTINANSTAQFSVAATGAPTLRYQWFFAGNPLPGATNTSLSIPNALPINQGIYFVTVSNNFGYAISSNATLTVLTFPPVITRQPTNVTVIVGNTASLSVQATGSVTLAYQWLLNGAPLPGRTSTALAFQSAQFSNAGNYSIIVTNPYGAVTSSVATLTVNPIPPCVAVHDGLVSWWRGEGNALDNWDSNNGTTFGSRYTPGKVGNSILSPLVSVNDSSSLRVTNGLTLEAWVNPSSLTGVRVIVTKFEYPLNQPLGNQSAYLLGTTNNGALFFMLTPNGSVRTNTTLLTTNTIPVNQWSHVAATYDGSVMRLYINGSQVSQTNYTGRIFPGSAPFGIGGFPGGTSSPWQYSGSLDEVSLYNRALSAAEIQSIFAADLTGKCFAPPVITQQPQSQAVPLGEDVKFTVGVYGSRPLAYQWYSANPGGADVRIIGATNASLLIEKIRATNAGYYFVTVTNSVGSNYSARAQLSTLPAPSCVDVLPGLISWWPGDTNTLDVMGLNNIAQYSLVSYPTGKVASAFTFIGISIGNRITINNSPSLNFGHNANFSIEMWIKANPSNTTYPNVPLFEKRTTSVLWVGYSLSLNQGRLAFALGTPSIAAPAGVSSFVSTGPDLRDAMFHHVAVTVNRSVTNGGVLYVDGLPVLTFNPTARIDSLLNASPLYIGGPTTQETNSPYSGLIDEPAIYNRALTAAEILSIRTAGAAGRCRTKPVILTQPVGGSVALGSNFTMSVVAVGTPQLRYQWRQNGGSLSGATNSTLTLSNVFNSLAGTYSVVVSNAFGSVISSNAIVVISNRPPTALSGSFAVNEDSPIDVLLTGTDPDGNNLTYSIVTQPTNGILSGPANSRFRVYTPRLNYNGPDFFTYKVNDGFSDSAIATMSITVRPVNDAPTAASQEIATDEDEPLNITLQGGDVDGDIISYELVQQPVHGVLSGTLPNLTYTPAQDYFGSDYFTFVTRDPSNAVSQLAAVSIIIRSVNDAPVARIIVSPLDQLPGETNTVLISPACCDTTLVLDGSQSSDVENVPLTYIWMDGTNVIATTATFTNQFAPGVHELALIVSDGELTGTELLTVEILKTEEAVLHLQSLVQDSSLARNEKAALGNWLRVTVTALEHCNVDQAVMFLERFEGRVAERISVINAKDAERWITISQAIREVAGLCGPVHRPGGRNGNQEPPKSKSEQEGSSSGRGAEASEVRVGKSSPR